MRINSYTKRYIFTGNLQKTLKCKGCKGFSPYIGNYELLYRVKIPNNPRKLSFFHWKDKLKQEYANLPDKSLSFEEFVKIKDKEKHKKFNDLDIDLDKPLFGKFYKGDFGGDENE